MKKPFYALALLAWLSSACTPAVDKLTVFNVVGTYQLILYSTRSVSDPHPGGTVTATEVDEDHVNLMVKGQSGKLKITYSYANVLVQRAGSNNAGGMSYSLTYKKQVIGGARVDGVSRFIELMPSGSLHMEALEL